MEPTQKKPLPLFRQDLEIYRGPNTPEGSPTYNLYDPIAARYYKISWEESLILQAHRPGMTADDLAKRIVGIASITITAKDIAIFFEKAAKHNLLQLELSSEKIIAWKERKTLGLGKWIASHYLYLRIPLFNPDRFLEKTLPYVRPLASKGAFIIYILLALIGLFNLVQSWDQYVATFPYFFTRAGFTAFVLTLLCVKLIHEFSHAYTAKYFGIQVPRMGVALLVFWPVFFTDVTHGWRLQKRSHRFAISAAGIAAEFAVAGIALLLWSLVPPGTLKSVFFILSSTSLLTSILININPALRFDGYYLLSDAWGIDNLRQRAFAVTHWKFREWLFGLEIPPPEEGLSNKRMVGMILYSVFSWIYRLFLMSAIALFIYFTFTKTIGLLMIGTTLFYFLVLPLWTEMTTLIAQREKIRMNVFRWVLSGFVILVALWVFLPLPHEIEFPGITAPKDEQIVYVPYSGDVEAVYVQREEMVKQGEPLLLLRSYPLLSSIAEAEIDKEIAEKEIDIYSTDRSDPKALSYLAPKISELARIEETLAGLQATRKQLLILAEKEGKLINWNNDLWIGQPLKQNEILGKIAEKNHMEIHAYIPEKRANDLMAGQKITFFITSTLDRVEGTVRSLHPVASEVLFDPELSMMYGGPIPVQEEKEGGLLVVESYYYVIIDIDKTPRPLRFGEVGWVEARGPWRSYFVEGMKYLLSLFWRQSSF